VYPLSEFSPVPLTLEGSSVLHQFFRFDWKAWRTCPDGERKKIVSDAMTALQRLERAGTDAPVRSAIFSQLGHKGDLIFIHFRDNFEQLNQVELDLAQLAIYDFLELRHSYVSVVELGLYESSRKTWEAAEAKGLEPGSPEFQAEVNESMKRAATAMAPRLHPAIPEGKYISFYPMDRLRSGDKNWYLVLFAERQRMMHEHGMIGRKYGDQVKQIITGSIGMDDWEWGVTLFAEDPVVFKRLIYEMRFDEVSAIYALFGQFYLGIRLPIAKLSDWLSGKLQTAPVFNLIPNPKAE
jgi:chlorite dismutase